VGAKEVGTLIHSPLPLDLLLGLLMIQPSVKSPEPMSTVPRTSHLRQSHQGM
jgi:hypothetical protein